MAFLGRKSIIKRHNDTGEPTLEECAYTLYHVVFNGIKRPNLSEDFLFTYDGKKAPTLDFAIENGWTGKRFMDSGEFPAHKKGIRLNIDDYINYVNKMGDHLDAMCCMDYIPRESDGPDWMKISAEVTWRDYLYQRSKIRPEVRDKFIYIIHIEDVKNLLPRALEYRDELGMPIRYMGAGLALSDAQLRLNQGALYNEIFDRYNYTGQCHGFGLQVKNVVEQLPFLTSSDSSSAVREQASGIAFIDGNKIKIAEDTAMHHKGEFTDAQYKQIEPFLRQRAQEAGIDFDLARVNASERFLWNCRERSKYIKALDPAVKPFMTKARGLLAGMQKTQKTDWRAALTYSPELEAEIQKRQWPEGLKWWLENKDKLTFVK